MTKQNYIWRPVNARTAAAIRRAFSLWEKTPHVAGQQAPKMGVDCIQLISALLCSLTGRAPIPVPRRSQDSGIHSPRVSMATVRFLRRNFACDIVRDGSLEPGDIVGIRGSHTSKGPRRLGHAMMVGVERGTGMHCTKLAGARITTLSATTGIVKTYRPRDKHLWS